MTTTDQTNKVEQRELNMNEILEKVKRERKTTNHVRSMETHEIVDLLHSLYDHNEALLNTVGELEEFLAKRDADNGWCFNMEAAPEKEELFLHHPNWLSKIIIGHRGSDGCFYDRTNSHITNQPIAFKPILLPEQREFPE